MNIEIVMRTHNLSNIHKDRKRYINITKTELIAGCLTSLVNSCKLSKHNFNFIILDDHSTDELFEKFDKIFATTLFPVEIINLEEKGFNNSALKQFEYAKNSKADLVYSVEDDYLHCPSAMTEMVDSYYIFLQNIQKEVCIFPFDMPDDYKPPWMEPCYVVHGSKRHWRTGNWTTQTMLCKPEIFQNHWELFEKLALGYCPIKHEIHEGNTIYHIWKNHVPRFSPIQSLALHMQFDTQIDPFIDWKYWWDNYTCLS